MTGKTRKTIRATRAALRSTRRARRLRRDALLSAHLPWVGIPLAALHLAWWGRRYWKNRRQRKGRAS